MGVYEGSGQLNKAFKQLLSRWEETKMSWNDSVSAEFEDRYILPLQDALKATHGALGEMSALLEQIRRDCT